MAKEHGTHLSLSWKFNVDAASLSGRRCNELVTCLTAEDKLREVTVDPIVTLLGFTGVVLVIENDKDAG